MQYIKALVVWFFLTNFSFIQQKTTTSTPTLLNTENRVIVITLDGYRWRELFTGADSLLINNQRFTAEPELAKLSFWDDDFQRRREKLMPFMWNVIAKQGTLYGNRNYQNEVNVSNVHGISYPGYNEMFTGQPDIEVSSNARVWNERENVFEYLCSNEQLQGKFAAFTSWDVFPYILNTKRSGLYVNSDNSKFISTQESDEHSGDCFLHNKHCRNDIVTYLQAKNYLQNNKPSIFYLALGETDEYAHKGDYFNYLQKAKEADRIIEDLWYYLQTNDFYKGKTTLLITTDHGRGNGNSWTNHNSNIKGSSQIWMAAIGNQVSSIGECKKLCEIKQKQFAATIAGIYGAKFGEESPIQLMH
jgi:hypothetical protein